MENSIAPTLREVLKMDITNSSIETVKRDVHADTDLRGMILTNKMYEVTAIACFREKMEPLIFGKC